MIFLWEIYSIFMQISSIVLVLQHGRRAHTLLEVMFIRPLHADPMKNHNLKANRMRANLDLPKLLRSTLGEGILLVSLLSGCCAISGFGRHLGLADNSLRFHSRALNPAG